MVPALPDRHLADLLGRFPELHPCDAELRATFTLLSDCLQGGGKLLLCGNGGSAADCEHWSAELLKGVGRPRPLPAADRARLPPLLADRLQRALPAIPLPSLRALDTAVANDTEAPLGFAQATWALGQPGDVLVGITTSGRSRSVRHAIEAARARDMAVLILTGLEGAHLAAVADVCLAVPRRECWAVQELHLPVYHCLSRMLEDALLEAEGDTP